MPRDITVNLDLLEKLEGQVRQGLLDGNTPDLDPLEVMAVLWVLKRHGPGIDQGNAVDVPMELG
jgi:hypothetical protein